MQRQRGRAFELIPAPAAAGDDKRPAAAGDDNPPAAAGLDNKGSGATSAPNRAYMWCSGLGFVAFVLLVVVAKADVGVSAMCLVALLQIAFHPNERALLSRLPWSSMLLLCGLLTYLGLMQKIGTIDSIAKVLHGLGAGIALVLVLAYLTAILCNIESSTLGVLGLMTPIVYTAFAHSPLTFWVTCAVTVPAALMVMNPIHVAGTLIISNSAVEQQEALFRRLLTLAVSLAVIVPGLLAIIPIALL
ncbi:MAG: putative dicarboxylate carrier protein [Pseudonocardia sp.]|nr:putative dicarboxylate carrier protein [Pseudonocardia sp.]